ncbi:hypothetical protein SKAU_G00306010 [Synaphobranchus kaupii]|uniref:Uncharacterized protein n=1 Tax=Synaphobranchus kaupii TaxID=118154 RepID=A0A9Q1IKS6_SYNKA|nr:hypothetical protein SKAU_G00306010 [Synaphobranchus kaupii]
MPPFQSHLWDTESLSERSLASVTETKSWAIPLLPLTAVKSEAADVTAMDPRPKVLLGKQGQEAGSFHRLTPGTNVTSPKSPHFLILGKDMNWWPEEDQNQFNTVSLVALYSLGP